MRERSSDRVDRYHYNEAQAPRNSNHMCRVRLPSLDSGPAIHARFFFVIASVLLPFVSCDVGRAEEHYRALLPRGYVWQGLSGLLLTTWASSVTLI